MAQEIDPSSTLCASARVQPPADARHVLTVVAGERPGRTIAVAETPLVLVAPRPIVDQALEHSSIDEILPIAADVAAARGLLAP